MNDNRSIFVIVPAYNEASVILNTLQSLLEHQYSVIVVDDGSTDETGKIVSSLPLHYIRHKVNLGQGAAIQTGLQYALSKGASFIVTFDADGQHDTADISKMIEELKGQSAGIAFGSRFLAGADSNIPFIRKLVLRFARFINYLVSGILLSDANNGIRAMTREAAEKLNITENRSTHSAQIQNLVRANRIKYIECPVNVFYSPYSRAKGVRNISSIRILYELILFKLFR